MQVIIPMAGCGQRFIDKGYKEPKPLIDMGGKTMIERVVDNIGDAEYIFICNEEHCRLHGVDWFLKSTIPGCKVVQVGKTDGSARTILAASHLIDIRGKVLVANCDQIVDWKRENEDDAAVTIYNFTGTNHPKWSYTRVINGKVDLVVEKQVISDLANVGVFKYSKGKFLINSITSMIYEGYRVNNEFYLSPSINYLIQQRFIVKSQLVNKMYGTGTPEDLEEFMLNPVYPASLKEMSGW